MTRTIRPLLDAVLVDVGGTLIEQAEPGTPVDRLVARPHPGVVDDLRALAAEVPVAAVTNTSVMTAADVKALLAPCGIAEHLTAIVTSVDVGRAKPDPAPLLAAAEQLGLGDLRRVLFLGDARSDAEAAAAAGMPYVDASSFVDGRLLPTVHAWIERNAGHRVELARAEVTPIDPAVAFAAGQHHERLTKPPGSLGRLEAIGIQLAAIAGECPPPVPEPAAVVVFAADHGVATSGVTMWPQEVTAQMVTNFCAGGAAINVLARHARASVTVVDVGVAAPLDGRLPPVPAGATFVDRKIRAGTADLSRGPALTRTDALRALDVGVELAQRAADGGARCLVTGDMGIGNTTAAAAVIAAVTGKPPAEVTGRGAGADEQTLRRKVDVISDALHRVSGSAGATGPLSLLEQVGGRDRRARRVDHRWRRMPSPGRRGRRDRGGRSARGPRPRARRPQLRRGGSPVSRAGGQRGARPPRARTAAGSGDAPRRRDRRRAGRTRRPGRGQDPPRDGHLRPRRRRLLPCAFECVRHGVATPAANPRPTGLGTPRYVLSPP